MSRAHRYQRSRIASRIVARSHRRRLSWAFIGLAGMLLAVTSGASLLAAHAAHNNIWVKYEAGDGFRVYDYTEQLTGDYQSIVDWPVSLLFSNAARVDKVKDRLVACGFTLDGIQRMNGRLNDGAGWLWDVDAGVKTPEGYASLDSYRAAHVRIYADSDDRMYNTTWGYYCIATCHLDYQDWIPPSPWAWYGYSEYAENFTTSEWRDHYGDNVTFPDSIWMNNVESPAYCEDGNHWYYSNGYASKLKIAN